jgi:hypothetical protein
MVTAEPTGRAQAHAAAPVLAARGLPKLAVRPIGRLLRLPPLTALTHRSNPKSVQTPRTVD